MENYDAREGEKEGNFIFNTIAIKESVNSVLILFLYSNARKRLKTMGLRAKERVHNKKIINGKRKS